MLYHIFHIALQYLRTTYRGRTVLLFSIVMPLIFTFVLGAVIGDGDGGPVRWSAAISNEDEGEFGRALVVRLQDHPDLNVSLLAREEALAQTEAGEVVAMVVIPADFSSSLQNGETPTVELMNNADDIRPAQSVELAVDAALSELSGVMQAAETATTLADQFELFSEQAVRERYFENALGRAETIWSEAPPLVMESQPVTRLENSSQIPDGFQQSSPGMLVTFALVSILNGAIVLIIEREQGTLRRLLVMPMRKFTILTGKLSAVFVAGLIQAAILILFGQYVFGVNWGQAPAALALLVIAFSFSITSLGMLIAGVARTYAQANALANILMYSIAAIGGAWWPIDITPEWMQRIAQLTPTYWAMQGFHDIITRGLGVQAILPEIAILLGFGILFISIGVWRFRYE